MATPLFLYATFHHEVEVEFRWLGKVMEGIRAVLNKTVLKCTVRRWNEEVKGVLLSYHSLKLMDRTTKIVDDFPALKVQVKYSSVVFAPRKGHHVDVTITRATKGQLSGKILNLFPVIFPSDGDDLSMLTLSPETNVYSWKDTKKTVVRGDVVSAELCEVRNEEQFVSITGKVLCRAGESAREDASPPSRKQLKSSS